MIHSFAFAKEHVGDIGRVIKSDRSISLISALDGVVLGEGVSFESGCHGMVTKLGDGFVEVMVFADSPMAIGEEVARTGEPVSVSVGEGMLGDTFDALGHITSEEKEPSSESENRPVETEAWRMDRRAEIRDFLATGVTIVDTVVPIAKGQRELIIGDQKTGKTSFLLQTVKMQARLGTVCILALIGKEESEILRIKKELDEAGVMNMCVIIAEPAGANSARLTLVPFTAMAVAEHFRDKGKDSLVVIDDLAYHAVRYREMALLSDRFPGRDSYPSDIFYLHARLLERAGAFLVNGKRVTISCLPVVTTVDGDIAGYIQTNLMSMTDGHLYFDRNLFFDGIRPAVNIFISVTRVGRQTQSKLARELGQKIIITMTNYAEVKRFLRFGTELTEQVKESIRLAHGLKELLKQNDIAGITPEVQIWLLGLLWSGKSDGKNSELLAEQIQHNELKMLEIKKLLEEVTDFDNLVEIMKNTQRDE